MNLLGKGILVLTSALVLSACNVNFTTSKSGDKAESGWETYNNDQYGYSVQHPKGWLPKDYSSETTRQIYVYEPNKRAYVKVDAYKEDKLDSPEAMKSIIQAFKERITSEQGMTLKQFNESIEGEVGGYIASGEQEAGEEVFLFENRALLSTNGRVLIFHRSVSKEAFSELDETLDKIIKSFSLQ